MPLGPWPLVPGSFNWKSSLIRNQVKLFVWPVPVHQCVSIDMLHGSPQVSADQCHLA